MDIVCPQCSTEYEFEDSKVTEAGVTVKCANCGYTFKVRRRQIVETEPVIEDAEPPVAEEKLWMVQTTHGEVLRFKELPTLQQWIVERKVGREDRISRTGETWKRLGDIAELSSFFQVIDAAAQSSAPVAAAAPAHLPPTQPPIAAAPQPAELDDDGPMTMGDAEDATDEPAFAAAGARVPIKTVGPQAAWEAVSRSRLSTVEEGATLPMRRTGKLAGMLALGAVVIGLGAFTALKPQVVKGFFSGLFGGNDEGDAIYRRGRELLLKDDEASLRQADLDLTRAPGKHAAALAARVEVATTWAQHLREQAELLERHAEQLDAKHAGTPAGKPSKGGATAEEAKGLRLRASKLRDDANQKLTEARGMSKLALDTSAEQAEVLRALADLRRMQGRTGEAVLGPLQKVLSSKPDDPETFYIEGAYWAEQGNLSKAIDLLREATVKTRAYTQKPLLRAAMQLAMIHLRAGRRGEARELVRAILGTNPAHGWARELDEQITREEQSPVPAVAAHPADAGAEPPAPTPDAAPQPAHGGGSKKPDEPPLSGGYDALVRSGDRLAERGRTMQAMAAYEAALKKNPSGVEALSGLAYCQLDIQRYSTATRLFLKALNISPTYGEAMIGMAESYKAMGNKSKALDYYKAYLSAHSGGPKASLARRNVSELERELGAPAPAPAPAPSPEPAPGAEPTPAPAPEPAPAPAPEPTTPVNP